MAATQIQTEPRVRMMKRTVVAAVLLVAVVVSFPAADAKTCTWPIGPAKVECEGDNCLVGAGITPNGTVFAGCIAWDNAPPP